MSCKGVADDKIDKCPLCREPVGLMTDAEAVTKLMALAKRGVAWAQTDMGNAMIHGGAGFKKHGKAGLAWLEKAAAQNFPRAIYDLSKLYRHGLTSVLRKSRDKANELLLKSANLGYGLANSQLPNYYLLGRPGFEKDPNEAFFRASVAFALDSSDEEAAMTLGNFHYREIAPEPSPYLACYYLNTSANKDEDGMACYCYGNALMQLSQYLRKSQHPITGFNVAPAAYFWLRKSCDRGYEDAREMLKKCEIVGRKYCHYCQKEAAQTGEKLKQCSKCKAQWYCSKECQVEAWRAGHKQDCKRASIWRFEDYLNAK